MENAFVVNNQPSAADNRFARIIETDQGQVVLMVDENQETDRYELIATAYSDGVMLTTKTGFRIRENAVQAMDAWDEKACRGMYMMMGRGARKEITK